MAAAAGLAGGGRRGERLHQHLIHAARDWDAAGREPDELYRGACLASALDWSTEHGDDLNELEREFLAASRAELEQETESQRHANRRLRTLLVGLAGLLVLALATGVVALNQRGEARDAALAADAQRLGLESLSQEHLDRALLLQRASVQLDESPATLGNLPSVLMRAPAAIGVVNLGWPIYGTATSPDGSVIATGDERGTVIFYDAASRKPLGRPYEIDVEGAASFQEGSLLTRRQDPRRQLHGPGRPRPQRDRRPDRRTQPRAPAAPALAPTRPAAQFRLRRRDVPAERTRPARSAGSRQRSRGPGGAALPRRSGRPVRCEIASSSAVDPDFYASATADRRRIFLTSPRDQRTWEVDAQGLRVLRLARRRPHQAP